MLSQTLLLLTAKGSLHWILTGLSLRRIFSDAFQLVKIKFLTDGGFRFEERRGVAFHVPRGGV
eukprot:3198289-Karenia_brevis.AAC.1